MKNFAAVAVIVAGVVLVGCGPTASKCTNSAECALGRQCIQGECRATQLGGGGGSGAGGGSAGGGFTNGGGVGSNGGGSDVGGGV